MNLFRDSFAEKMPVKQDVEQIRFSAAAHACYHFDQAVVLPLNQFVKVIISFDFHFKHSSGIDFCNC